MRALIADDDRVTTTMLAGMLAHWRLDSHVVEDGDRAWEQLSADPEISIAVIDWEMPGIDGRELCRRIRETEWLSHLYVILLTGRSHPSDIVAGLDAGADDYLVKPFNREELRARVSAGLRIVGLQQRLADRVAELERAAATEKHLRGLIPICCYCKRVRTDENYWQQVEMYVSEHSDARFSHGICPACFPAAKAAMER